MATAAFRQTTTVAHSPSDCLHDVIDEVWVVALAFGVGRLIRVLSAVLYILCRVQGSIGASSGAVLSAAWSLAVGGLCLAVS